MSSYRYAAYYYKRLPITRVTGIPTGAAFGTAFLIYPQNISSPTGVVTREAVGTPRMLEAAAVFNGTNWRADVEIWNGTSWRTDGEIWTGTAWVALG